MTRRVVTVQVVEVGGVPVHQYVELSNTLAAMPPGEYNVTIEPVDADEGDTAYNDGYLAAIVDGRRRP